MTGHVETIIVLYLFDEQKALIGFENVYCLFIVTECKWEYIEPDRFL